MLTVAGNIKMCLYFFETQTSPYQSDDKIQRYTHFNDRMFWSIYRKQYNGTHDKYLQIYKIIQTCEFLKQVYGKWLYM